ncbi:MAG: phosphoribosylformylglycinamidine synthase I, partial [Nitrospinae bacterium]|nr:phosphoribosylformylglycinamidine synthase I [Nitrospinota bacterium]
GGANGKKNVLGMMPHPERCADPLWPDRDGQLIFKSLIQSI